MALTEAPGLTGAPPEKTVVRMRRRPRGLLFSALVLLAVTAATGFFFGNLPEPWQDYLLVIVAALLLLLCCVGPYVVWLSRRYTITTRRIILRHGVFVRTRQELLHSRGYQATVKRGPIQALFGAGNVSLATGPEDESMTLKSVPNPRLVQTVLAELVEQNRRRPAPGSDIQSVPEPVGWGAR